MSKFIYNPSTLYTLLFKGGSVEIKPGKAIEASDFDMDAGIYTNAEATKQVEVYATLEEVPAGFQPAEVVVVSKAPVTEGLTAEQLKVELEEKAKTESKPLTTSIGVKEPELVIESKLELEEVEPVLDSELESTEPVKATRGRKPKA